MGTMLVMNNIFSFEKKLWLWHFQSKETQDNAISFSNSYSWSIQNANKKEQESCLIKIKYRMLIFQSLAYLPNYKNFLLHFLHSHLSNLGVLGWGND